MQTPAGAYSRQPRIAFRPVARPPSISQRESLASYALDVLCFAIPLLNFLPITLIGTLPGGELLTLAAVLPCLVLAWKRIWRGYNRTILILMGLWFLSQLVTDFYRHSPFPLMAKGLAAISFFAIDLIVVSALAYKKPRRIVLLIIGEIIGYMLAFILNSEPDPNATGLNWKFGYAIFVIPAVILVSSYFYGKRQYWIAFLLLIGIAGENLLQNYRSEMLIIMASSMLVIPLASFGRQRSRPSLRLRPDHRPRPQARSQSFPMRTVVLFGLVVLVGVGTTQTYSYLAARGALGDRAQEKYQEQSRGKFGLLVGGRPETLVSWRAVLDSPLLGHGSWAEDLKYSQMLADIEGEAGYLDDERQADVSDVIPIHSYLMSAWVWAGFLGAVFWFYILYLSGKATLKLVSEQPPMSPYFAYLLIGEFWRVLFSPFGYTVRMEQSIVLVIICSLIEAAASQAAKHPLRPFATRGRGYGPVRASVTSAL